MHRLNYSQNFNGKFLNDVFVDIRPYDFKKFEEGYLFEIAYKNKVIGIAEVEGRRPINVREIKDSTAMVIVGASAGYLKKLLNNFYPGTNDDSPFYMLFFKWKHRDKDAHEELFREWWEKKLDEINHSQLKEQPSLF